jgi:hypothetical protein
MHPKPCFVRGAGVRLNHAKQPPEQTAALRLRPDKGKVDIARRLRYS